LATRLGADVAIDQGLLVACKWCGQRTRPDPACELCGSPLDRRLRTDTVPALSDDLLKPQVHAQRAREPAGGPPPAGRIASVEEEPDRSADDAIVRSPAIADTPFPPEDLAEIRVEAPPAVPDAPPLLAGRAWGVAPIPAVRSLIRKEMAKTWGARVGGFVGLVFLLDFLVNHV
jgi:hypothetical protein